MLPKFCKIWDSFSYWDTHFIILVHNFNKRTLFYISKNPSHKSYTYPIFEQLLSSINLHKIFHTNMFRLEKLDICHKILIFFVLLSNILILFESIQNTHKHPVGFHHIRNAKFSLLTTTSSYIKHNYNRINPHVMTWQRRIFTAFVIQGRNRFTWVLKRLFYWSCIV